MDVSDDLGPLAPAVEPVERAQRAVGLAFGGAEGGEVVMADQRAAIRNDLSGILSLLLTGATGGFCG